MPSICTMCMLARLGTDAQQVEKIWSDAISVALQVWPMFFFAGICVFSENRLCWSTQGLYDQDWNMSEL